MCVFLFNTALLFVAFGLPARLCVMVTVEYELYINVWCRL